MNLENVLTAERLILVGPRGAGKTVCGRRLSEITGATFVDTDDLVERESGMTIARIFASEGENGFRERESRMLAELGGRAVPEVVATGGGIVLRETNRRALAGLGITIYMRAPAAVLARRVAESSDTGSRRPSLLGLDPAEEIQTLTIQREPLYLEVAHVVVESDRPVEQVARRLQALWQSLKELHSVRHL